MGALRLVDNVSWIRIDYLKISAFCFGSRLTVVGCGRCSSGSSSSGSNSGSNWNSSNSSVHCCHRSDGYCRSNLTVNIKFNMSMFTVLKSDCIVHTELSM